jgi:hypothetical protein
MSEAENGTARSMRQMVSVLGKLDAIEHSTRRFTLLLDSEERVPCLLVEGEVGQLGELFGRRVLASGMAVWNRNGKLDRIEVELLEPGGGKPKLWALSPRPLGFLSDLPVDQVTPGPRGGAAIIGKWPGDETDEQIEEALKRLSWWPTRPTCSTPTSSSPWCATSR